MVMVMSVSSLTAPFGTEMPTPVAVSIWMSVVPWGPTTNAPPSVVDTEGQPKRNAANGNSQVRRMDLKRTTFLNSALPVVTPHLYRESGRKWNVGGRQTHSVLTVGSDMNRSAVALAFLVPLLTFAQQPVPTATALPSLAPLVESVKSAVVNVDVQKRDS